MKVRILETGQTMTVNDEYAERLVEQGKAEIVIEKKAAAKAEEPEPAKAEEPAPAKSGKKK